MVKSKNSGQRPKIRSDIRAALDAIVEYDQKSRPRYPRWERLAALIEERRDEQVSNAPSSFVDKIIDEHKIHHKQDRDYAKNYILFDILDPIGKGTVGWKQKFTKTETNTHPKANYIRDSIYHIKIRRIPDKAKIFLVWLWRDHAEAIAAFYKEIGLLPIPYKFSPNIAFDSEHNLKPVPASKSSVGSTARGDALISTKTVPVQVSSASVTHTETLPPIRRYSPSVAIKGNPFHETLVTYIGRNDEFNRLEEFAAHEDKFKVWAISGPSGAGKTRLACKWLLESKELKDWDQIILEPRSDEHADPDYWKKEWHPYRNTVLIIDHLYNFRGVLHALLDYGRTKQEVLKHNMRVLLIDHVFPKTLEELHKDSRLQFSIMDGWEMERLHPLFFDDHPLNLEATPDQNKIIPEILRNAAGADVAEKSITSAIGFLEKTQGAWHPLFAILIGDALKKAPKDKPIDFTTWNRRHLIKYYLSGEQRLPWMQEKAAPIWASAFIAVATALNGVNFDGSQCDEAEEGLIFLIESKADTLILFELPKIAFDGAAQPIDCFIVDDFDLAIFAPGNHWHVIL